MLKIEYRELAKLKPNPKNPRKATEEDIKALAASIEQNPDFFEARPILLSDRTGEFVIIGGEQRYKAAKFLNLKEAPTILFSGLTEEREDEIMNRDNTHSGTWDIKKLESWDANKLSSWGVPIAAPIDTDAVEALFIESNQSSKSGVLHIKIEVPNQYESSYAKIKEIINAALSSYPKIIIK